MSSCLGDDDVAVEYYGAHTVVFSHISQENINRRDHPDLKRILRITEFSEETYHTLSHRIIPKCAKILLFVRSFVF